MHPSKTELLLGCGFKRDKRVQAPGDTVHAFSNLLTADCNTDCEPTFLVDLLEPRWAVAMGDDIFDEVHAYEVLEHLGQQGDAPAFFNTFRNIWRVLKPDGYLCATVPSYTSMWAWGDPSHTRVINAGSLVFLDREEYNKQLGVTSMSDFRAMLDFDFARVRSWTTGDTFRFIMQAKKPRRPYTRVDISKGCQCGWKFMTADRQAVTPHGVSCPLFKG